MDAVFIIQFENETSEETNLDNEAYKSYEMAEKWLFDNGYEKKMNWADKPFYEREGFWRYASILKLNVVG